EDKPSGISIRPWTLCELPRAAIPCGRTGIRRKVISDVRTRGDRDARLRGHSGTARRDSGTAHPDIHPPGLVRLWPDPEESAIGILEHPVTPIGAWRRGRRHIDRDPDGFSRSDHLPRLEGER